MINTLAFEISVMQIDLPSDTAEKEKVKDCEGREWLQHTVQASS